MRRIKWSKTRPIFDHLRPIASPNSILRTVVNYDVSLALNIDSRVAQARNRNLAITRLRALLSMPTAHPKFPNLQPLEI